MFKVVQSLSTRTHPFASSRTFELSRANQEGLSLSRDFLNEQEILVAERDSRASQGETVAAATPLIPTLAFILADKVLNRL